MNNTNATAAASGASMRNVITHPGFDESTKTAGITYGFLTRNLVGSTHRYIPRPTEDNNSEPESVFLQNRRIAMEQLEGGALPEEENPLSLLKQIHSNIVVTVEHPLPVLPYREGDALVTKTLGVAVGVLTADCVPVLFADPVHKVIGAAHAGWKGAKAGIVENTLAAMENLGAACASIQAIIGPCIRQASYEVSAPFYEDFVAEDSANAQFFRAGEAGHYHFNLPAYVKARLAGANIAAIYDVERDTLTEEENFFSYRRCTKRGEKYTQNGVSVIKLG